jgi:DNA-binding SARP family transcriptional activator
MLTRLVEADPDGWRAVAVEVLSSVTGPPRGPLLHAIVHTANRGTVEALARMAGADVAEAVRTLHVRLASRLFVRTLGNLSVHKGSPEGPELPISKRRLRTMLGLLAAHAGRPLSRDQIIDTIWPEAELSAGVNNLNQTVFQLRRELDPAHRDGESPPYLVNTPEAVYLHPELVRTDLDEARRLSRSLQEVHPARRQSAAESLLDLIRGEFLLDLRYEDWTHSLQTRVHAEVRGFLRPLMLADGIEFTHEVGVRAACAALSLDEYDEVAQYALVRQLASSGKRAAANSAAERYVARLRTELDEDPPPELLDLMKAIRQR